MLCPVHCTFPGPRIVLSTLVDRMDRGLGGQRLHLADACKVPVVDWDWPPSLPGRTDLDKAGELLPKCTTPSSQDDSENKLHGKVGISM